MNLALPEASTGCVLFKRDALKNLEKFTRKHLRQSLLFNKVAGLKAATLLKKRLRHRCFLGNLAKFFKSNFFYKHFQWLFLHYQKQSRIKRVVSIRIATLGLNR